jgi:hypothetical protein
MDGVSIPTGPVLGLLRKLIIGKAETRRRRFEQVHKPLFDGFLLAHRDYMTMFDTLRAKLSPIGNPSDGAAETISQLNQAFAKERRTNEGLRSEIRAISKQIVQATKDPFERRFTYTILCYLLEHELPFKTPASIDRHLDLLDRLGHDGVFNTPSSYILDVLSQETDIEKLRKSVYKEMERVAGYLSDVTNAYASLQYDVYK